MMRNAVPRFVHTISRMAKTQTGSGPSAGGPNLARFKTMDKPWSCNRRSYFRGNRHLPIRRPFFEEFFNDGGRMMAGGVRDMQKMMDAMRKPYPFSPFWAARAGRHPCNYARPVGAKGKEVEVKFNEKVFEVKMDVREYAPEDLNVRIAGEKLTISGQYQEKPDEHGMISREFTRQFLIPEEVEADTIESLLTSDGYLLIKGKVKGSENIKERAINIEREPVKMEQDTVKSEETEKAN